MKIKKESTVELLKERSILKQEVYAETSKGYCEFREIIKKEIEGFKKQINDERVRLKFDENGKFETHAFVGSDVLVFNMHTNIFTFPNNFSIWKDSYVQEDKFRGYFGIIHVYNFLAESFLQSRLNDVGELIARIFINKDGHFMIEGVGELGYLYRNLRTNKFNAEAMMSIFECSVKYVATFDLRTPPFEAVNLINVMQIKTITSSQELRTGKRLGFKFKYEGE